VKLTVVICALMGVACTGPAQAAPAAAMAAAGERAAARLLKHPKAARFRNVAVHGDIVCGEIKGNGGGGFTPFIAYDNKPDWVSHAPSDGLSLKDGLRCFDLENAAGRKVEACKAYDFNFYFAYDHFCR
jgi:hypothetical protein